MDKKFLKSLVLIVFIIGFIVSLTANIYNNTYLAKISMLLFIIFGIINIVIFLRK
ncbi:MAG: hypothetical protein E6312_07535 [Peptoniphilus grossensis]|uniref:hypothetical protein n=1 Tax=uncultured Peptoniphilus sp. TaxID=254354 RepID=UPI00258ADBBB|nr:hypothetical protein [uncultured Peptoniphilus sp.]MDU6783580.1 hypothetical protein [Peptoniphilus harei]MDU7151910.1 hypothetical protein [Peptoniphilus grossensis]